MLSQELLRKVRLIEVTTRKVVDEVLTGQYKSHFKGYGVQFSEHRQYVPGDDIRHIDWKVSARSKDPLIKKYEEERELPVFIVVDLSHSEGFGSSYQLKSEIAAELGGMLAYAASHTGDRVGVLIFAGEIEQLIPPKKGKQHILRIIRDLLSHQTTSPGTDMAGALEATARVMKHRGVVFIISDFLCEGYEVALKRLARKHDVVAILVRDEREEQFPELGTVLLTNPETGEEALVDTSSYSFKKWLNDEKIQFDLHFSETMKTSKVEVLRVLSQENYADAVVRFFQARARRR